MDQGFRERRSLPLLCRARLLAHRAFKSSVGKARDHIRDLPHLQRYLCGTSVHIGMVAPILGQVLLGARYWAQERYYSGILC